MRTITLVVFAAVTVLTLLGCATGAPTYYSVEPLPLRQADLYPLSVTREGLTVAVDEIAAPERAERYFGADLRSLGVLPVNITVSARDEATYRIGPADLLLHRRTAVIDPLPVEHAVEAIARAQGSLTREGRDQLERYLSGLAFSETTIEPGGVYQGLLFFPVRVEQQNRHNASGIFLTREPARLVVVATNDKTGERVRFGPFPLAQMGR
jgi:hypothetical protein